MGITTKTHIIIVVPSILSHENIGLPVNLKEVLKILISRFQNKGIDFVLSGGLALSTMGIFRFTKDIDFLVYEESKKTIHDIMTDLGYQKQDFSTEEIFSYWSPIKALGQIDYLFARRKYTRAMMRRAKKSPVFDGKYKLKTILPEDLIGLKVQAISNDPRNRFPVDAPDIQRILQTKIDEIDMDLVRMYFELFSKEDLLEEWLGKNFR
jgi:predicted nucleotidyltransferase